MINDVANGFGLNLAVTAGVTVACMLVLWGLSLRLSDMSIVDIFWGPGFAVIALTTFLLSSESGAGVRRVLAAGLTVVWGLRLGTYLWWRNHGKGEDPRYTEMLREKHRTNLAWHSLTKVFLLQGALMWLISVPVQLAAYLAQPPQLGWPAWLGVVLWVLGFGFEAVGDAQLARFKADPANRGRVMDRGLWRYTRHPNYFGNACLWWGLWLIACDRPVGLLTVFAPVLMTHFLLNVTGKALLERRLSGSRPGYAEYVARTSGFFPLPPRGAA
jgi:steroid 5-alpha reductase family enzyme